MDYTIEECINASERARINILKMSFLAGKSGSHLGGSLSCVEILVSLYCNIMNIDKNNLSNETRDRFIFSKGHGVPALYAVLNEIGILKENDLKTFKSDFSDISGHPSMNEKIGIEFSSGSLGQGLSLGVGTCLGLKRKGNFVSRCFVLLGDGECNEGQIWEAAESASHYKLNNLVAVVDNNGLQYDGETKTVMNMGSLKEKWQSFGWNVVCVNGHNFYELLPALSQISEKPLVVIANTIKGKGVSFMENAPLYHHTVINENQLNQALEEVNCNG